jgi:hypothetical protein
MLAMHRVKRSGSRGRSTGARFRTGSRVKLVKSTLSPDNSPTNLGDIQPIREQLSSILVKCVSNVTVGSIGDSEINILGLPYLGSQPGGIRHRKSPVPYGKK